MSDKLFVGLIVFWYSVGTTSRSIISYSGSYGWVLYMLNCGFFVVRGGVLF